MMMSLIGMHSFQSLEKWNMSVSDAEVAFETDIESVPTPAKTFNIK